MSKHLHDAAPVCLRSVEGVAAPPTYFKFRFPIQGSRDEHFLKISGLFLFCTSNQEHHWLKLSKLIKSAKWSKKKCHHLTLWTSQAPLWVMMLSYERHTLLSSFCIYSTLITYDLFIGYMNKFISAANLVI